MTKRLVFLMMVAATLAVVAPAHADHCTGPKTTGAANPPNPYYGRGTLSPPVLGYTLHTGLPGDEFVGAYYQDGYMYVDLSDPSKPTWRSYNPYNPGYFDVKIVGGASPRICVHVRTFNQWPQQQGGDGCILVGNSATECSFRGGVRTGTQAIPPVPEQDIALDLLGGYVAAAQNWAIYRGNSLGTSTIVWGSSNNSPPGGIVTFSSSTTYYACVGTVNTSKSPSTACTPGAGALVAHHL